MARLHVVVDTPSGAPDVDALALEAQLAAVARELGSTTCTTRSSTRGARSRASSAHRAWRHAFPPAYQDEVDGRRCGRATSPCSNASIPPATSSCGSSRRTATQVAHIKLYRAGGAAGALRRDAAARAPRRHGRRRAPVRDRGARRPAVASTRSACVAAAGDPLADPATQTRVADVFLGVWAGTVENDGLNRLVLHAGLEVRDVVIVRALCQYLRQAGVRFTDAYLADTLHDNADVVRLIVASLPRPARSRARARRSGGDALEASLDDELGRAIDAVASLDADRILRALWQVVRRDGPHQRLPGRAAPRVQVRSDPRSTSCPARSRSTRSGWRRPQSRACTCAPATSPAAASAGPTAARTSAPRCSGS